MLKRCFIIEILFYTIGAQHIMCTPLLGRKPLRMEQKFMITCPLFLGYDGWYA